MAASFDYDEAANRAAHGWENFCRGAVILGITAMVVFGIVLFFTT